MPGINQTITQAQKKYGKDIIRQGLGKREFVDHPRLPTYIFPLDYATGGGFPLNILSQIFGPFEGGKSTLAILLARALSQTCMSPACLKPLELCRCKKPVLMKTAFCGFEGVPADELWFNTLQYDPEKHMVMIQPEYGEQGAALIEAAVRSDDCGLVIVDSLAGIVPKAEVEADYEDALVAVQSRLVARMFRKLNNLLIMEGRRGHRIAVIFINQVRAIIGGFGSMTEGTPGGFASKHGYRLSIRSNQLSVDKSKGEMGEDNLKNVLRISCSMMGGNAKQQLFCMAGKCEFKIAIRKYREYFPGSILDCKTTLSKYEGPDNKVFSDGKKNFKFAKVTDVETEFKTNSPASRAIRYIVLQEAKKKAIEEFQKNAKVIKCG